jgi:hypothetical protein
VWRVLTIVVVATAVVAGGAQPAKEAETVLKRPETADPAVRCVLPGMPWIGFYRGDSRGPEEDPFPASVRAFLEYKGENLGLRPEQPKDPWHVVYMYLKGTCGASFRMGWDGENWDWGTLGLLGMPGDSLTTFRDGLTSAGYGCEMLLRRDFAQSLGLTQEADYDEAAFRERILASIRAGVPVLGLGVVGPPECSLITGYDEGGKVLVGRSYFQDEGEFAAGLEFEEAGGGVPDPYFRKRDWFAETRGLILIGDKIARPSDHEINLKTLRRALDILRTPVVRGRWSGQAAFTMWADTLLKTEPFPPDDQETLRKRHSYHHATGGTLAEARAYGADFLRHMADQEPAAADELREAAKCFDDEHDLVWAIWEFTGGMIPTDEGVRKFGQRYVRGRLAPLIRLARRRDAEAASHLQKALELMGGEVTGPQTAGNFGRAVLEDVPRIGYNVHLCPFPGSLFAVMKYLGDPVDYDYLMGITGAAFRRLWNRDDGGNVDLSYLAPEPYQRASLGIGYELQIFPRKKGRMLDALRESIAKGRPAIAFGIVGPPEAGIVTGYDQGGDVLTGWSYFQDNKLPGYYSEKGWFEKFARFEQAPDAGLGPRGTEPVGLVVVGDKFRWPGPSQRELLISALQWAVDLARTAKRPNLPDHVSGLAAYEAWAKGLEVDADYPAGDQKVMETRAMVHCDQVVMLYERRQGAQFLRSMVKTAPEVAAQLNEAADLYEQVGDYSGKVWRWGHWRDPTALKALADSETRLEFASQIRVAAATEGRAVERLEAALKILTGGA